MIMRKYIIIAIIVILSTPSFSQLDGRRRPFGITAGLSIKNTQWKEMYYLGNTSRQKLDLFCFENGNTSVFQLGFTIIPEFKSGVGIQTGVHFEFTQDNIIISHNYFSEYIQVFFIGAQIPICLQYRYELSTEISLIAYSGPSLHYGAIIYSDEDWDIDAVNHVFVTQWGFGAGVQFNGFQFRVTTNLPLLQFYVDDYFDEQYSIKVKNPVTFSLSYLF